MKYLNKESRSNIILFLFIVFVSTTLYIGHALKVEHVKLKDETIFSRLASSDFENLERIKIANKQGDFVLEKNTINLNVEWRYKSPQNYKANNNIITSIKSLFDKTKLKTKFEENEANLTNFFPEQSKNKIILNFPDKEIIILAGLQNTIDKSLYIKFEDEKGIYQVESPLINIDALSSRNFINSRPFQFSFEKIHSINIVAQNKRRDIIFSNGSFKEGEVTLDLELVKKNLLDLKSLESDFLIETLSDEQRNALKKYLDQKENLVELKLADDSNSYQYSIINSPTLFPMADLKLKEMVLIYAHHTDAIYFFTKAQFQFSI